MKKINLTSILLFIVLIFITNYFNLSNNNEIFHSPDEVSNYLSLKEYGENSKLYLDVDVEDKYNLLHPRGFITYENKIVPFNFLGIPVFYGTFWPFFKENIKYISIIFLLILILIITKIFDLINPKNNNLIYAELVLIFCTPLTFYLNFPLYNVIPALVFLLIGIYYLIKFAYYDNKCKYFYFSLLFLFLSIWFRYNYVIFIFLFFIITFIKQFKQFKPVFNIKHIFLSILLLLSYIVIPLLLLNKMLYGKYLTYGYSLFAKTYFPVERTGNLFQEIINIFFPSQVFNIQVFLNNIFWALILISPIILILFISNKDNFKKISHYMPLGLYMLIYAGMNPNTYMSGIQILSLHKSIIRYWLPIHLGLAIFAIFSIKNMKNRMKVIIIPLLLILSFIFLYQNITKIDENYSEMKKIKDESKNLFSENTYLLTAIGDKYLYDETNLITWWCSSDCQNHINIEHISKTIILLSKENKTIYVQKSKLFDQNYFDELETNNIKFNQTYMKNIFLVKVGGNYE